MKKLFLFILTFLSLNSFSQDKKLDLYNLNFGELSKLKIVTASKTEQSILEVPATIKVISNSEIKEKGYFTLDEMISDLPGFQFRNIMSQNSYIFQRGIPNQNNKILVLIDGVQLNELNSGGFYGGGQFNFSNIERVEVVYGPSSVAYGTNAVTGIINIISKGYENSKGSVTGLVGNFNTLMTDASCNYFNKKGDFKVRVSAMVKRSEKANLRGAEGDNNWTDLIDNFENDINFGVKINYKDFTFGTNYLQKQTSTATLQKSAGTTYRDFGTLWNILFINNYLKYIKNFSEKVSLVSTLYNRNSTVLNNTIYYVTDTAQVGYYRPNNLTGIETVINYKSEKNFSITGGVTGEYEILADKPSMTYSSSLYISPPTPGMPLMHSNYLISVFIEPRYILFKNLFLSAGFRFDQSSIYKQVLTPRAGLSYNLRGNIFRFAYAEAFRAPKPWDYTDGIGNTNLLPEKMNSFEASFYIVPVKNFNVEIIGYRNVLYNSIYKETLSEGYRWINRGEINTTGAELCLVYSGNNMITSLNYTFTDSKDEYGVYIPEISKHSGNASITYSFGKSLKLNLRGNYMGERENIKLITSTNSKIIDPYFVLNGAITWFPVENFFIQLIAKNILDAEYYHTSNREPERYRQPQRTLMLSVGYNINK